MPSFLIVLHEKDLPLLVKIKKSLGVGKITRLGPSTVRLQVQSLKELVSSPDPYRGLGMKPADTPLEVVFNHFDQFPLITNKRADFKGLKEILFILKNKEHLTPSGLRKIVAIKTSINRGLSEKLLLAFPDVVPVERPEVELPKTIDPE